MPKRPCRWHLAAALVLSTLLAACAETPAPTPIVTIEPPPAPPPPKARPKPKGHFKLGPPYAIRGVQYEPTIDWTYDAVGEASWYGPRFHGRATANGEQFDQNELTAAHTTLPLPSVVRVTNLDNGRSVVLRVNDRGPFLPGRILDVSRRAAQMLGFVKKGFGKVRVRVLEEESRKAAREVGWKG